MNPVLRLQLVLTVCSFVLLSGCQPYSMKDVGQKAYVLNGFTGSVSAIENGGLSELKASKLQVGPSPPTRETLRLPNLGDLTVVFSRKWKEEAMFYTAILSPYDGPLKTAREGFSAPNAAINIDFEDEDSFQIHSLRLPVSGMTRVVNSDGKAFQLVLKGQVPMSEAIYRSIRTASIGWSGFPGI